MIDRKQKCVLVSWSVLLMALIVGASFADIIIGGVTVTTGPLGVEASGKTTVDADATVATPFDVQQGGLSRFNLLITSGNHLSQLFVDAPAGFSGACITDSDSYNDGMCFGRGQSTSSNPYNKSGSVIEAFVVTADVGNADNHGLRITANEAFNGNPLTAGNVFEVHNGFPGVAGAFEAFSIDFAGIAKLSSVQLATVKDQKPQWSKDDEDGTIGETTGEHTFYHTNTTATVLSAKFIPDVQGISQNDTNFKTLIISKRNSAGGGRVTVGSFTTQTTGPAWSDFNAIDFGTLSNTAMLADEILTIEITKTGDGGTKIPAGVLIVEVGP